MRRERHDLGACPAPALKNVRIAERESGIGSKRNPLTGRPQRRRLGRIG